MPFINLNDLQVRDILPGCHMRAVHSANMTVTHWRLDAGAVVGSHSHMHEQITTVINGELELTVDGETRTLTPENTAVILSGSIHSARALTECCVMDVFSPVRDDYK